MNGKSQFYLLNIVGKVGALLLLGGLLGQSVAAEIPNPAIIAHRGDSYDAPESTELAYQLACRLGADYLELDLQRTKDGKLIALHDNNLKRTTNVASVYPDRADAPVSEFTLAELKKLDAGSWFNKAYPERARTSFNGLKIVTLQQVSDIAKSCPNHPGLYIETKVPDLFPGIEKDLKAFLQSQGWLENQGSGKVILQTFEKSSLIALLEAMPDVPAIFLLWAGDGYIAEKKTTPKSEEESYADYYSRVEVASEEAYEQWLDFAKQHGAAGVGPSTVQTEHSGDFSNQFSYMDLAESWMVKMSHDKGLLVHAYTVDQKADFESYRQRGVDGFFTNRPDIAAQVFGRNTDETPQVILDALGY